MNFEKALLASMKQTQPKLKIQMSGKMVKNDFEYVIKYIIKILKMWN